MSDRCGEPDGRRALATGRRRHCWQQSMAATAPSSRTPAARGERRVGVPLGDACARRRSSWSLLAGVLVSLVVRRVARACRRSTGTFSRPKLGILSRRSSARSRRSTAPSSRRSSRWLIAVPLGLRHRRVPDRNLSAAGCARRSASRSSCWPRFRASCSASGGCSSSRRSCSTSVQPWLIDHFGPWPVIGALFQGPPYGIGLLTAGLVLAIMVLPFITAVMREVFQ